MNIRMEEKNEYSKHFLDRWMGFNVQNATTSRTGYSYPAIVY